MVVVDMDYHRVQVFIMINLQRKAFDIEAN